MLLTQMRLTELSMIIGEQVNILVISGNFSGTCGYTLLAPYVQCIIASYTSGLHNADWAYFKEYIYAGVAGAFDVSLHYSVYLFGYYYYG